MSNWKGLGKVGGVRIVEKGLSAKCVTTLIVKQFLIYQPSEVFVGDNGSNLFSIDLRTGGILYSYKGEVKKINYHRLVYPMFARNIGGCYIN